MEFNKYNSWHEYNEIHLLPGFSVYIDSNPYLKDRFAKTNSIAIEFSFLTLVLQLSYKY
jgi:hypothetical protein